MRSLITLILLLFITIHLNAQNVGINTTNPQEQLHVRSDSTKIALRLDNKKNAQGGFDYNSTIGSPSQVTNAPAPIDFPTIPWTDLAHSKIINSDNTRMNGPLINIHPDYTAIQIRFTIASPIPSNATITDVSINGEWRRTSTQNGTSLIHLYFHTDTNFNGSYSQHYLSSNIDQTFSASLYNNLSPLTITPDIINNGQYFLQMNTFNLTNLLSRIEIDKLSIDIEYKTPTTTTQNVSWTTGAKDGVFKISNSADLNNKEYLTIDESGVTQLNGLRITKNAGPGKVLTSNNEGRAYWADVPTQELNVLWINKEDTAFYAKGPIQVNNNAPNAALIFNKGDSRLNNGVNMVETDNRLLNIIIDADNNQTNEQFNIYKDSTEAISQNPSVRFNLGGNDSWVDGIGNFGLGTTTPQVKFSSIGTVRSSNDTSETEYVEIKHGGNNGIINTVGDGRLYFQHDNSTKMSITEEGKVGIGFLSPTEQLDINGAVRLGNTTNTTPLAGTIRWNETTSDFEGFNGNEWKSLTQCSSTTQNNNTGMPNTNPACCEEQHTGSTSEAESKFGSDVAIYGSYAAILNPTNKIFIFKYENGNWAEDTILIIPISIGTQDFAPYDKIDMSEHYLILGDVWTGGAGRIYIYERNSNNDWSEPLVIESPNGTQGDLFGNSVAVTDDYFLVCNYTGLYIYQRINNTWSQQAFFTGHPNCKVSIYGETIALVGSTTISIFEKFNNFWGITQTIMPSNGISSSPEIDIYGDYIIVGVPNIPSSVGSAYIFKRNSSNIWTETAILNASDISSNPGSPQDFGNDVSIWGDYAIIGSNADINGNDNKGKAYIFHFNGTSWEEIEILTDPIGTDNSWYGRKVSTDGINRIAGASDADINGINGKGKVIFGPID